MLFKRNSVMILRQGSRKHCSSLYCIFYTLFSNFLSRYLHIQYLYIKLACLSVRLYPTNVITAEPIGLKFCLGPHGTPGKVYEWSKIEKFVFYLKRFQILKIRIFFIYPRNSFFLCFLILQWEHVHNWNRRRARSALKA